MMKHAVFIDRDGVINRATIRAGKSYPPQTLDEFELLPGVAEALNRLKKAGFLLIVVTNQPDVAKGIQTRQVVEAMHERLRLLTPVDDIRVCYHVDEDHCLCRKPKPGMLLDAAKHWSIDLKKSYMVGDRWRDVDAGVAAGCKAFFIESDIEEPRSKNSHVVVSSLLEAADSILS